MNAYTDQVILCNLQIHSRAVKPTSLKSDHDKIPEDTCCCMSLLSDLQPVYTNIAVSQYWYTLVVSLLKNSSRSDKIECWNILYQVQCGKCPTADATCGFCHKGLAQGKKSTKGNAIFESACVFESIDRELSITATWLRPDHEGTSEQVQSRLAYASPWQPHMCTTNHRPAYAGSWFDYSQY